MLGKVTGVLDHERHGYFGRNFLLGLFNPFPNKSRAQDIVSPHQPLPGGFQPAGVNLFWQVDNQLLYVNTGVRFHQPMKQHSLLHRGEGEAVDD